jgi:dTDP-glucose 4,6-dehydratase
MIEMKKLLVTGGAGFIGINFIKHIMSVDSVDIVVADKFTYASNPKELVNKMKIKTHCIDLANKVEVEDLFKKHEISHIVHFAAESHVDRSIEDCQPFVQSNIVGTINLLDQAVKSKIEKFVHISTDEVFGEVPYPGKFNEYSNLCPRNPYSASKASAENFVQAYGNTYDLPYTIVNCSNNYGPWQYPEKFIPVTIGRILQNKKIPVYGRGDQIREWIYVKDAIEAIRLVLQHGKIHDRYCIGSGIEVKNIDLVRTILSKMNANESLIEYVADRPGHDKRYAMSADKIINELNWTTKYNLSDGLDETIEWIKNHENRIQL